MHNARNLLLVFGVFGLGVLLIVIAARLATRDPAAWLNAETRSRISADYSADLVRPQFGPLDPRIIAAAAADDGALDTPRPPASAVERVVPANITPAPTATNRPSATSTPQPGATATKTSATATVGSSTPGPSKTPTPISTAATPSSTPTPQPTSTPTPTSTATSTPTATQTPTPTATSTPTSTATPQGTVMLEAENCSLLSGLRSLTNNTPTTIRFENLTDQTVRVYWLDFLGNQQLRATLAPGQSYVQDTFVTHAFVVRTLGGSCIAVFRAIAQPGYAPIEED